MYIIFLKILRRIYSKIFNSDKSLEYLKKTMLFASADDVSDKIFKLLNSSDSCMVARYGAFELGIIINYLGVSNPKFSSIDYIKGNIADPVWNKQLLKRMECNAGFFPASKSNIVKFCKLMLEDSKYVDVLGDWMESTNRLSEYWSSNIYRANLLLLEPYWSENPWSRALKDKRVLVIHPFADLIEKQYSEKRDKLFKNKDVLPEFNLRTIKAVQSIGGECNDFKDWFEALDWMEREMDKEPYDIALIGCGAYGFPLAAYSKRTGHKAIHLAGALQLLFGIRGKRWDDPNYGVVEFGKQNKYNELFNEYWVYPDDSCKPKSFKSVEGGCYW